MEIKASERMTVNDTQDKIVKKDNGDIICNCQPEGGLTRLVSHADGVDFYQNTYNCQCGNVITVRILRAKEDRWF